MRSVAADLHVHTALSPCAGDELTPPAIVAAAAARGLELIAVCDHNAAGNAAAVQEAARGRIGVVAGMEIMTVEEVHVVALFPGAREALAAAREVQAGLPADGRAAALFGSQPLMDASGAVVGCEPRMLAAASRLDLAGAAALVRRYGGIVIAAHVDRPSFSVMSQLGMLPVDVRFDALEISALGVRNGRDRAFEPFGLPLVTGSDSHSLDELGACVTWMEMAAPTFGEIGAALGRPLRREWRDA